MKKRIKLFKKSIWISVFNFSILSIWIDPTIADPSVKQISSIESSTVRNMCRDIQPILPRTKDHVRNKRAGVL